MIDLQLKKGWQSFLRIAQRKIGNVSTRLEPSMRVALRAEAEFIAGAMREKFDKVRPANARITKILKGSSKPLVGETGDLRNSIGVTDGDDPLSFYIGVPEDSESARLAVIHEKGLTIVQMMTDKQRRWIHANLPAQTKREKASAGDKTPGIIVIHIPARPFIEPTFRAQARLSSKRFTETLLTELGL